MILHHGRPCLLSGNSLQLIFRWLLIRFLTCLMLRYLRRLKSGTHYDAQSLRLVLCGFERQLELAVRIHRL